MLKNIFLVFLMFAVKPALAQVVVNVQWQAIKPGNTGDTIYYDSNRKLTWPDFKGTPIAASPAAAVTESGFGYRMNMQSYNSKTSINITVFCYFSKSKSWVKKKMNTAYALLHEQHHFDVTYINACLFVKKLNEAKLTKANFVDLVEKIHDECFAAMNKMQNDYDGETANGRIEAKQFFWNKKIDDLLIPLTIN